MTQTQTGVLLLNFGGPDSHEAIGPFIENIMGGRKPPPIVIEKAKERYNLIGGKSPLPELTAAQAKALGDTLSIPVYAGMLHWHPSISETLHKMVQEGITKVVALSLAPHFARVSTGAYFEEVKRAAAELQGVSVVYAANWYNHPLYIEALAELMEQALEKLSAAQKEKLRVIFSAHSLPVEHIQGGDPYVEQLNATIQAVLVKIETTLPKQAKVPPSKAETRTYLAYQSKGGGQSEWLGPMVEEVLDQIAREGGKEVLLVPVGFVSDHVETLYDIDIAIRSHAEKLGLHFIRSASLNTSPKFIEALAEVVREAL